ncbi:MAG: DUF5993 family protein [Chlamydiae bacterium]|nr:DUF5993 family protein [Chlamydiota bacterium]
MMALLFLLFTIVILLIIKGKRKESVLLTFVTLILSLFMYWHHITLSLNILL